AALLLCLLGIALIVNWITNVINKLVVILSGMAAGRKMEPVQIKSEDEIGVMASSVNTLIDGFDAYANFAEQIGQGNLDATFKPLSESDILGNALIEMKESLKRVAEEDNKRTWMSEGLALFSDILRKYNDDIQKLSYEIIANLVGYIDANQGGIFILNEEDLQHRHLEMLACYAYDKHKMMKKQVNVGEGLLGQSFKEQDTLNIREVPDNYVNIVSGLGEANPNNILIVPLTSNDITIGVVELVAFEAFSERDIEFVEKVSESITITISSVKSNLQTKALLEESQELTEQMRAQEEEMRQNVEELQATQEEMQRNTKEMRRILQEEQKKQALLTSVIDSPKDMVIALDEDYKILSFNEAALAWFYKTNGVKLSVGVNILPMLTLQQREAYKEKFKQAIEGAIVQYEEEIPQEEAPSDFYEHRYYPLKNDQGSILGLSIVTREVSTRKHKEKELLKSNQHLQESEETLQTTLRKVKEERNTVQQKQQFTEQQLQAINESTLGRID
ncbi:MAG: GAF domain-containing protein, partial [Bacteroidota bacterium]